MSRKIIGITVGTPMNPKKISSPSDEQVNNAVNEYLDENPVSVEPLILTDQITGKKYRLSVINGKLTMSEVK